MRSVASVSASCAISCAVAMLSRAWSCDAAYRSPTSHSALRRSVMPVSASHAPALTSASMAFRCRPERSTTSARESYGPSHSRFAMSVLAERVSIPWMKDRPMRKELSEAGLHITPLRFTSGRSTVTPRFSASCFSVSSGQKPMGCALKMAVKNSFG